MLTNGHSSAVFLQHHRYYAITFSWIKYSYSLRLSCTPLLRWKNLHVSTLPCSDNPIFTYAFRCLLWACVLDDACNIIGNFINASFTLPHTRRIFATTTFLLYSWFRPVHSEIRQWIRFSTYSPWAFYRPPAYRQHRPPLDSFPQHDLFGLLSADFNELQTFEILPFQTPVVVSGGAFQGVTPSFHSLDYQFY